MLTITIIILIILAYLAGSIPTAVWVGKLFYKTDVREYGSGNAGATNTIRVLGWKAGIPVIIVDICKGYAAVQLSRLLNDWQLSDDLMVYIMIILGLAAVIGHVFPVFAGFRGGKGVATFFGVGVALYPFSAWIVLGIFIIAVLLTGYVSVSSMIAAIAFPVIETGIFHQDHTGLVILAVVAGVAVPLTHLKNIRRLIKGEEKRFIYRKKKPNP